MYSVCTTGQIEGHRKLIIEIQSNQSKTWDSYPRLHGWPAKGYIERHHHRYETTSKRGYEFNSLLLLRIIIQKTYSQRFPISTTSAPSWRSYNHLRSVSLSCTEHWRVYSYASSDPYLLITTPNRSRISFWTTSMKLKVIPRPTFRACCKHIFRAISTTCYSAVRHLWSRNSSTLRDQREYLHLPFWSGPSSPTNYSISFFHGGTHFGSHERANDNLNGLEVNKLFDSLLGVVFVSNCFVIEATNVSL